VLNSQSHDTAPGDPSPRRSLGSSRKHNPSSLLTRSLLLVASAGFLLALIFVTPTSKAQNEDSESYDPKLFGEVALYLQEHYLDPDRIAPRELIEKTFATLENSVDEIFVENSDPTQSFVAVNVDTNVKIFDLNTVSNSKKSLSDAMAMLRDVFLFLQANYNGETALSKIQYAVLNGFLGGLDPHTLVFSPDAFKEFYVHIEGEIGGVGMYVGTRDGKLQVIEVLKDTPAFRAKFKKGDFITRIGDESTINMTVKEAVERIRGPRGSTVTLTIKRPLKDEPSKLETKAIPVKRARVVIKSVESKLITGWNAENKGNWTGGVGYVICQNFDKNTYRSLRENLRRLRLQNGDRPLAGLLLDLRGNSGGLLTQAIEMCDYFLESGNIVSTATRGEVRRETGAKDNGDEPTYPIIVLANQGSASGAEIVAGALQKNHRAILLGTSTFGKGSVQQLHRLSNEAQLKITVSEYLIPGNISIQENGVVPDILAEPVTFADGLPPKKPLHAASSGEEKALRPPQEPAADAAIIEGEFNLFPDDRHPTEKDYEKHIVSRFAREEFPQYTLQYFFEPEKVDPDSDAFISGDLHPERDELVQTALELIRVADKPFRANELLANKKDEIEQLRLDLFDQIVTKLKEKGVDWRSGDDGGSDLELKLSHEFVEVPSGDDDDPISIPQVVVSATATNKGSTPFHRLKGISKSDYYPFSEREFLFGKVDPNQSVTRRVRIRLPYFPNSRDDLMTFELTTDNGKPILTQSMSIRLEDQGRPRFRYEAELRDSAGKAITAIEPGMDVALALKITNTGSAAAHKGIAILRNETGRQVFLKEGYGRIEFTELAVGAIEELEFRFEVRAGEPVESYKFELAVVDSYSRAGLSHALDIPRGDAQREGVAPTEPFVNGKVFEPPVIEARLFDPDTKEVVLTSKRSILQLESSIRSPRGSALRAWVVSNVLNSSNTPPDKIIFASSGGKDHMELKRPVPIREGVNLVTVFAKDDDNLESRLNLFVRREATATRLASPETETTKK
jgi:carboxyl-terminal processing protease